MTVDGQNIDLINYWAHENLSAGDQLIFKLERKNTHYYGLNHYYKETRDQSFSDHMMCWQLVPSVFRMGQKTTPFYLRGPNEYSRLGHYDCRTHGYWRIAQLMQSRKQCSNNADEAFYWNDDKNNLRAGGSAQLLQVLFAPVYKDMRVSDMPIIHTIFEKVTEESKHTDIILKKDKSKIAFNSIVKPIRCIYELILRDMKYKKKTKHDYLMLKIQENAGNDDEIKKLFLELEYSNTDFQNAKTEQENQFVVSCAEEFKRMNYFGINEEKSLALDMICSNKTKENIISIFPSSDEKYIFKGVDFSGLGVELFWYEGENIQKKDMMNFFLRTDTLFLNDTCKQTSKFISNTVNRNILTRYNDEILMGFLIENLISNKNDNLNMRCIITYKVIMENIEKDGSQSRDVLEITQYRINLEVHLHDCNGKKDGIGYRYEPTIDVLEVYDANKNMINRENSDAETEKMINIYLKKDQIERGFRTDEQEHIFVVDLHKFVLDYERQKLFFKTKCDYGDKYKNAVSKNEIEKFETTNKHPEAYKPRRTQNERDRIDEIYRENNARYAATMKRLNEQESKNSQWGEGKYQNNTEDNAESRSKKGFVPLVHGAQGRGDKKDDEDVSDVPNFNAPGITNPILPRTDIPETKPPIPDPVAVQAPSKRSKVSLSRQQAANATMEES